MDSSTGATRQSDSHEELSFMNYKNDNLFPSHQTECIQEESPVILSTFSSDEGDYGRSYQDKPLFMEANEAFHCDVLLFPVINKGFGVEMTEDPLKTILADFQKTRKVAPKPRSYRGIIIQGLLTAIRSILEKGEFPTGRFHKSLRSIPGTTTEWVTFHKAVQDSPTLKDLPATQAGPGTDGKSLESLGCNKKCMQKFFSSQEVREVYYLFIQCVFQASPERLCKAMKFKCCSRKTHIETCKQKWSSLMQATLRGILLWAGWEPYQPQ